MRANTSSARCDDVRGRPRPFVAGAPDRRAALIARRGLVEPGTRTTLREQLLQFLRMPGTLEGVFSIDQTAPDEIGQTFLDRDGALFPRDRDFPISARANRERAAAHRSRPSAVRRQARDRRPASAARSSSPPPMPSITCGSYLPLLRERIGDSRDGGRHVSRMQAEEHEVVRSRCRHRHLHRLGSRISPTTITSGAWRAPPGARSESGVIPTSICSMRDWRCGVFVFDRILDGDDVARLARVDRIHQRAARRRLAGTRLTADEDQPPPKTSQEFDSRWKSSDSSSGTACGNRRIAAATRPRS